VLVRCNPFRRIYTKQPALTALRRGGGFAPLPLAIAAPLGVALILRTIDAFKVFNIIYVMTRGGPLDSTRTLSFFVYQESFSYLRAGSGATYAILMTLMRPADRLCICLCCFASAAGALIMKRKLRILLRYLAALLVALSILAPMAWLF
jgi:hypothetical protein